MVVHARERQVLDRIPIQDPKELLPRDLSPREPVQQPTKTLTSNRHIALKTPARGALSLVNGLLARETVQFLHLGPS